MYVCMYVKRVEVDGIPAANLEKAVVRVAVACIVVMERKEEERLREWWASTSVQKDGSVVLKNDV